nr:unnamed protein product [Spirometra erinaceieuropaei]
MLVGKLRSQAWIICALLLLLYTKSNFGLPHNFINIIMEYHNLARKSVHPTASDMQTLTYDTKLEALAQDWAKLCKMVHPSKDNLKYKPYGQNLAASGNREVIDSLHVALTGWNAERGYYLTAYNSCSKEPCGHYTAMIWANTTKVGCA